MKNEVLKIILCISFLGVQTINTESVKANICPLTLVNGMNQEEQSLLSHIAIGDMFEHYSGKKYKIAGIFRHSEDLNLYVAYTGFYEDKSGYGIQWIRPLAMFLEEVVINDIKQPRFKKIG